MEFHYERAKIILDNFKKRSAELMEYTPDGVYYHELTNQQKLALPNQDYLFSLELTAQDVLEHMAQDKQVCHVMQK